MINALHRGRGCRTVLYPALSVQCTLGTDNVLGGLQVQREEPGHLNLPVAESERRMTMGT